MRIYAVERLTNGGKPLADSRRSALDAGAGLC